MCYTHSLCKGPGVESHHHVDCMVLWLNLVLGAWGKDRLPLSGLRGFDVGDPRTTARTGGMRDAWLMGSFGQVVSTRAAVLRFPFGCVGLGTR